MSAPSWFPPNEAARIAATYESALERISALAGGDTDVESLSILEIVEDALAEKRQAEGARA